MAAVAASSEGKIIGDLLKKCAPQTMDNKHDSLESDCIFAGFLVFACLLKKSSRNAFLMGVVETDTAAA